MQPLYRDLALVGPRPAELPLRARENDAGVCVDEQLRQVADREPVRVALRQLDHVGGLAVERYLPGPRERGTPRLALLQVGAAVDRELSVGQGAHDARGQHALHEHVLLQDHLLARGRAHRLEDVARPLRPLVPRHRAHDALHVGDALDSLGVTARPVEAARRAPIVADEHDALGEAKRVEPRVEVTGVVGEPVRAVRRLAGVAHADEVGGEAARLSGQVRDDVAPQVGRRWVSVEEHDGVAVAGLDVRHLAVEHVRGAAGVWVCCGHREVLSRSGPGSGKRRVRPVARSRVSYQQWTEDTGKSACPGTEGD